MCSSDLVNNAGILITRPLHEATAEEFDKTFGVNVKGYVNVSQAFVKGIVDGKKADEGTIVNISSIVSPNAMLQFSLFQHFFFCRATGSPSPAADFMERARRP